MVHPTLLITLGARFCRSISSQQYTTSYHFHHILHIGQIYVQNLTINLFLRLDIIFLVLCIAFRSHFSYILKSYDRPPIRQTVQPPNRQMNIRIHRESYIFNKLFKLRRSCSLASSDGKRKRRYVIVSREKGRNGRSWRYNVKDAQISKCRVNEPFVMAIGARERGGLEMDGEVAGCGHNFLMEWPSSARRVACLPAYFTTSGLSQRLSHHSVTLHPHNTVDHITYLLIRNKHLLSFFSS